MHSEKTIIHKLQNHHCIFALKHSKQRYTKQLRDTQPHRLGSSQQDSLTNTKLCSLSSLRTAWGVPQTSEDARSTTVLLEAKIPTSHFRRAKKSHHLRIDPSTTGQGLPSLPPPPRRGPPELPTAAAAPPAPLRSAVRAHLPARPPSSNPPPAPAAAVRRLPAARPVGAAPPLGTCEEGAGCVPAGRPGVRHGA